MRLWSLHPKYLDVKGLVALWREGLLARAVLKGKTKGYTNHPQLIRFKNQKNPVLFLDTFLNQVYLESKHRGYNFNLEKIGTRSEHLHRRRVVDRAEPRAGGAREGGRGGEWVTVDGYGRVGELTRWTSFEYGRERALR